MEMELLEISCASDSSGSSKDILEIHQEHKHLT